MQMGDVRVTSADISRLEAWVGFRPQTKVEEGKAKFVAWYREYYGVFRSSRLAIISTGAALQGKSAWRAHWC